MLSDNIVHQQTLKQCAVGSVVSFILQMGKRKHQKEEWLACIYTTAQRQSKAWTALLSNILPTREHYRVDLLPAVLASQNKATMD